VLETESKVSLSRRHASTQRVEVIIPTLNEEMTIKDTIDNVRDACAKLSMDTSMLVIDGNSKDRTIEICKKETDVKIVTQSGRGKGNAMREALEHTEAEIVMFVDGDGTYSLANMEEMIKPLLNGVADMVVGSRTMGKREKGSISILNYVGNKIFNKAINFAMNSHVTDSLSGYRALHKKTFSDLVLFSDSFEIEVEMTVEAIAKGLRVIEIPIQYRARKQASAAKLNPLGDGFRIARTLLFILMNVNPLKFFSIIALSFFLTGLYPGVYVLKGLGTVYEIQSFPAVVFSSLLFVTGTISFVVGLLAELVVRSRRRVEYLISKKL
jgi:glycosyltransferase involved in cell wall biosynthesis